MRRVVETIVALFLVGLWLLWLLPVLIPGFRPPLALPGLPALHLPTVDLRRLMRFMLGFGAGVAAGTVLGWVWSYWTGKKRAGEMVYFQVYPNTDFVLSGEGAKTFLRSLARALKTGPAGLWGQPYFRFLVVAEGQNRPARLYFGVPKGLGKMFGDACRASYRAAELVPAEGSPVAGLPLDGGEAVELGLLERGGRWVLPLKSFEPADPDPLDGVILGLGAGNTYENEVSVLDVLFEPVPERRRLYAPGVRYIKRLLRGEPEEVSLVEVKNTLLGVKKGRAGANLSGAEKQEVLAVQKKCSPPEKAFRVAVRLFARADHPGAGWARVYSALAGFERMTYLNALRPRGSRGLPGMAKMIGQRIRSGVFLPGEGFVLSSSELAGLVHIPDGRSAAWEVLAKAVSRQKPPEIDLLVWGSEHAGTDRGG